MMAGNPSWWSMYPPNSQQYPSSALLSGTPSLFPAAATSHEYVVGSSPNSLPFDHHNQHLPVPVVHSWNQSLLGGVPGEEERFGGQSHKLEIWENQILNPISPNTNRSSSRIDVKQEVSHNENNSNLYDHGHGDDEILIQSSIRPAAAAWSQMIPVSSPRSCITSLSSSNTLDFSYTKPSDHASNHSSECNSSSRAGATGGVYKKARVQPSSSQPPLKVRKEKLGDRITALHQLVSPFGKTDTASVLLEAIGYIRFLQGQIEALSTPYLGNASQNMRNQHGHGERNCAFPEEQDKPKDLRSRGLCLVPVSSTQQVGSDNGADYWAPAFGGGGSGF